MRLLKTRQNHDAVRGFTLLELMITIAVLGIAIIPMMMVYVNTWRSTIEAKRRNQASMLARQKVSSLKGTAAFANLSGTISNSFQPPYSAFNYKIEVEDVGGGTNSTLKAKMLNSRVSFQSIFGPRRSVQCPDLNDCDLDKTWDYTTLIVPMSK